MLKVSPASSKFDIYITQISDEYQGLLQMQGPNEKNST
jgi:hypothetical protein